MSEPTQRAVTAPLAGPPAAQAAGEGPSRVVVIANFIVFQACWFACVLGAARGLPWLGTASVAAMLVWHCVWVAQRPVQELQLAAGALAIGVVFDGVLRGSGAIVYPNGWWAPGMSPHWMLALWVLFAMTLNVTLRWLKGRWWLAAVLGAVSGPLSFWGGVRMGAATFADPPLAVALLAIGWGLSMPALLWLAGRFDGVSRGVSPTGTPAINRI